MQAPLTALLLCNDAQSLNVIDRTFDQFSVSTYFCTSGDSAHASASQRKFDLLMLDFDEPGATELVPFRASDLWGYPSVVIAMGSNPGALKDVLKKRVHFTLQKPFTPELMARTLKAGYSLIVNERRSSFRHIVRMPASARYLYCREQHPITNATVQDLSATGFSLLSDTQIPKDATVFADFELPASNIVINAIAKVIWSNGRGHCGLQFRFLPPADQQTLQDWLTAHCPWDTELSARTAGQHDLGQLVVPARVQ